MTQFLYILGSLAIVFFALELSFLLKCVIADLQLLMYSKRNNYHFTLGKYGIAFLMGSRASSATGILNGRKITIEYRQYSGRSTYSSSHLAVAIEGQNPSEGRLKIQKKGGILEKNRPFFHDEWDKKIAVESSPVKFGKKVLESKSTRELIYKALGLRPFSFKPFTSLHISTHGQVKAYTETSFINHWKIEPILKMLEEVSVLVSTLTL